MISCENCLRKSSRTWAKPRTESMTGCFSIMGKAGKQTRYVIPHHIYPFRGLIERMQSQSALQAAHASSRQRDPMQGRGSQQPVPPPSPALVRNSSKRGAPGAPNSAQAQVGVPAPRRGSTQPQTQHPYATAGDYAHLRAGTGNNAADSFGPGYGRTSPMLSSVGAATPVLSNVRAQGGHTGVGQEYDQQHEEPQGGFKFLCCRCG